MWSPGSPLLDKPATQLGFTLLEWGVLGAVLVILFYALPVTVWGRLGVFAGVVVAAAGLYYGKRGKPQGAIVHWLHSMGLVALPGLLSPRRQRYGPW